MFTSSICVVIFVNCMLLQCHDTAALLTYPADNLWESLAPGELLKLLERSTAISQNPSNVAQRRADDTEYSESNATVKTNALESSHKKHRRAANNYSTEDHLNPLSSGDDEYNYDQAYEEFVRQYFTDKVAENNAALNNATQDEAASAESVEQLSLEQEHNESLELEPSTQESHNQAKRSHQKSKSKCRKVRRSKHQTCLLCENAKTGEKSESCSWERGSEPQNYSFEHERERKRNYKKQQSDSDVTPHTSSSEFELESSSDEGSDEPREHKEASTNSRQNVAPNSCIKRVMGDKVCYRCHDSNGWNTQCHVASSATTAKELDNNSKDRGNAQKHKRQQTQQRIYKRTISYSYEKGTNGSAVTPTAQPNESNSAPELLTEDVDANASQSQEKFYIKVVKQNATLDE